MGLSLYMARGETISSRPMRASATTLEPETSKNELTRLVALLRAERLKGAHLEIGTAAGGTLRELMRAYPDETRPRFVVVDPMTYFPDQLAKVRRNLEDAGLSPNRVDFRVAKSRPALGQARRAGETFSFIFVDGAHKIRYVTEDLAWAELLEPGGIVCFHDYGPAERGVMMAVDRFLARHPNYAVVDRVERLLIVRKLSAGRGEVSLWDRVRAWAIGLYLQLAAGARKRLSR
jgi:predicted O-methyltransferase YrrM